MAFPPWHYPEPPTAADSVRAQARTDKVRDIFADYGEHVAVNRSGSQWMTQKSHKPGKNVLVANSPSVPLAPPVKLPFEFEDVCVGENIKKRKKLLDEFVNMKRVMYRMKAKMKKDLYHAETMNALKKELDEECGRPMDRRPPKWFAGILDMDGFMSTDLPLLYNSRFNGGLVSHLPLYGVNQSDAGLLINSDTVTRKELSIRPLSVDGASGRLSLRDGLVGAVDDAICEINSAIVEEKTGFVGVRSEKSCRLLTVSWSPDDVTSAVGCQEIWQNGSQRQSSPTSICVSPYMAGEAVICWDNGQVDIQSEVDCVNVVSDHQTRFRCADAHWLRGHYGATPRTLITTDHTAVDILDLRSARRRELELFAIPSKYCLPSELLMASCAHPTNPFYHFVATSFSTFMLDQRMPGFMVLTMHPNMRSVPQYIQLLPGDEHDDVLLSANQSARETYCYTIANATSAEAPPVLTDLPWRVAQCEDFIYLCGERSVNMKRALLRRFLDASLVGACALRHRKTSGLSVVQMMSSGDLFHQDYNMAAWSPETEKTCAAGLDARAMADDAVKRECATWLRGLESDHDAMLAEVALATRFPVVDATPVYNLINSGFCPHKKCRMCRTEPEPEEYHSDDDSDGYPSDQECMQCGLSLKSASKLKRRIDEGVLYDRENKEEHISRLMDVLQPPNTDEFDDPQSKILCKLWNEDYDFIEEIDERFKFLELERRKVYGVQYKMDQSPAIRSPTDSHTKRFRVQTTSERGEDVAISAARRNNERTTVEERDSDLASLSSRGSRDLPRLSTSDMRDVITKGVSRLSKYDSESEAASVIVPIEPGNESDFDDAELEMFQMANEPNSFCFLPDISNR